MDLILRSDREHEVFGRFVYYSLFGFRNRVISTLSLKLNKIELVEDLSAYKRMDARQKLEEWTRYKCHWIVPTLNDISTRIFDALITGGVLIVPEQFRSDAMVSKIDCRDCFFYTEEDILEPLKLASQALASFDACGVDGVVRRHRFALDFHNLDSRVQAMLNIAESVLDSCLHEKNL